MATNDSQNPAASGANGSSSSTAMSEIASGCDGELARASVLASSHAASISSVRWVGTERPESVAYAMAATSARLAAKDSRDKGTRRQTTSDHKRRAASNAAVANSVTCSPEI